MKIPLFPTESALIIPQYPASSRNKHGKRTPGRQDTHTHTAVVSISSRTSHDVAMVRQKGWYGAYHTWRAWPQEPGVEKGKKGVVPYGTGFHAMCHFRVVWKRNNFLGWGEGGAKWWCLPFFKAFR